MELAESKRWICEASEFEKMHEISHKKGTLLLTYQVSLSSIYPLQEDHVMQALVYLRRKCPSLRVCYGQRNGVTWLRNVVNEDIDFKVVNGLSADEVRDILQTYQYKSETGPLWCARLLPESGENPHTLDKGFPHTSQLFLGMHHGIGDGITLLKVLSALSGILNDVIGGKPIDDEKQIGHFISDNKTEKLVETKIARIQNDTKLMQKLSAEIEDKGIGKPLLLSIIPSPEGEDKTHNLTCVLEREKTRKFISRCKAEGVAVHSAFTALSNAALVTLLVEKQYIRDTYKLCNGHLIDLRRYWPDKGSQALGCHAHFPLTLWAHVPKEITENFWDFARNLHQELHHHLKEESALLREALGKVISNEKGIYNDEFSSSITMQIDVTFSNLGDITPYLTEGGPHVKPFLCLRNLSLHRANVQNFTHFFHTFRGRLILNLLYNTKFIPKEVTHEYSTKLFDVLEKVVATGDS